MERILLIEDEPEARLLLARRLAAYRLEVSEAADGASGFERARTLKPDLIILDLNLPGKDGFQLYEALKADALLRETPVLFLTAVSVGGKMTSQSLQLMAEAKHGIRLQGNYAIMGKPYDPKALVETIRKLLHQSPAGGTGADEGSQAAG